MNRSEINDFVLARYADYYERIMCESHGEQRELPLAFCRGALLSAESMACYLGLENEIADVKADIKKEWEEK